MGVVILQQFQCRLIFSDLITCAACFLHPQLSLHDQYGSYMESTLQLATNQGVVLPPRSSAAKNVLTTMRASLSLFLPDDDVGAVLGRKGQTLVDIQQVGL